jgi:hypothetical protein
MKSIKRCFRHYTSTCKLKTLVLNSESKKISRRELKNSSKQIKVDRKHTKNGIKTKW